MKMGDLNRAVEMGEVYHRPPTPGDLGGNKQATAEAWRKRSRFYCPFHLKSATAALRANPLMEDGE